MSPAVLVIPRPLLHIFHACLPYIHIHPSILSPRTTILPRLWSYESDSLPVITYSQIVIGDILGTLLFSSLIVNRLFLFLFLFFEATVRNWSWSLWVQCTVAPLKCVCAWCSKMTDRLCCFCGSWYLGTVVGTYSIIVLRLDGVRQHLQPLRVQKSVAHQNPVMPFPHLWRACTVLRVLTWICNY